MLKKMVNVYVSVKETSKNTIIHVIFAILLMKKLKQNKPMISKIVVEILMVFIVLFFSSEFFLFILYSTKFKIESCKLFQHSNKRPMSDIQIK